MDKAILSAELKKLAASKSDPVESIFLRLLDQVWQIDWTIAPYDVLTNMLDFNIPYFKRFMDLDQGDEAEEAQLIKDWVVARLSMKGKDWKGGVTALIEEVNQLRASVRKSKGW